MIIPVRNKQPHIARALNSVISQDICPLEIIVVDDDSTDGSMSEVAKFNDDRIRCVYRDTPGPGGYAARNVGVGRARGDWVSFLDADDEWSDNYLARLISAIEENPDVEIFSTGWLISNNGHSEPVLDAYSRRNAAHGSHRFGLNDYMDGPRPIWTSVVTMRKDLFEHVGGFDERWQHGADLQLWFKLLFHSGSPALWVAGCGATYHRDSVNMVTSKLVQTRSPTAEYIGDLVQIEQIDDADRLSAIKRYANKSALRPYLRAVADGNASYSDIGEVFFTGELGVIYASLLRAISIAPGWLSRLLAIHLLRIS